MTSLKTSKPQMDTQTLLALLASIKKWESLVEGTVAELSFLKSLLPPRSEWPYAAILCDQSALSLLERIRRIAEREVENDTTALSALATIADLATLAQKELAK